MTDVLTPHQRHIAARVIAEEEGRRRHLVVALSGAHAYGFPSPDSDLDIKAIHVAPTRSLLGLSEATPARDRLEVLEGIEIDYTSTELGAALRGLLKGNGNYLERVLGAHLLYQSPLLVELAPLASATLSKRYHRHYLGFARQQEEALRRSAPTAKKVLYVLRTALTGAHLLRSRELRVDLTLNLDEYGYADARELIERKKAGERTELDAPSLAHWTTRIQRAFELLDTAHAQSSLPEEPAHADALEAWLVDLRLREA